MTEFHHFINQISSFFWGIPMLTLMIGVGLYLSIGLKGLSITKIPFGFKMLFQKQETNETGISPFNALMTALSATVGTGNIVGVATAITLGGAGAIFWMWLIALLGTATKYSEAVLAIHYREKDSNGHYVGGPMYYIKKGLSNRFGKYAIFLSTTFSFILAIAGFSTGNMTQAHSIADALHSHFNVPFYVTSIILGMILTAVLLGGIKRISFVAGKLVPFMALLYMSGALIILISFYDQIPAAFSLIFQKAFEPFALSGGFIGGIIALFSSSAVHLGAARGVLSNEAGMGSAPIAHAASNAKGPVQQGVIAMLGTIIDTIIICTMTGLAILVTKANISGLDGVALTSKAFNIAMPNIGAYIVSLSLPIFGFTTILGWSYYCERGWVYLWGEKIIKPFRILWIMIACLSPLLTLHLVWSIAEVMTAFMVIPNLIGVIFLAPLVFKITEDFFQNPQYK